MITEVLPLPYPHGVSSGDFVPALGQFLGSSKGLSAAVITDRAVVGRAARLGVRADGRKELVAPGDGRRESTESWADLVLGSSSR